MHSPLEEVQRLTPCRYFCLFSDTARAREPKHVLFLCLFVVVFFKWTKSENMHFNWSMLN